MAETAEIAALRVLQVRGHKMAFEMMFVSETSTETCRRSHVFIR